MDVPQLLQPTERELTVSAGTRRITAQYAWLLALAIVCVAAGILIKSEYWQMILITFLLYGLYTLALNVIMGYAGQFAVANPAFAAVGAYVSAILVIKFTMPFGVALVVALIVAAVSAAFLGYVALRFTTGIFLSIITLSFVGLTGLIIKMPELFHYTQGANGLTTSYVVSLGFTNIDSYSKWYFLLLVVLGLVATLIYRMVHARTGRAWVALREDEALARSLGVRPTYYKVLAFVISGTIAALAGAFYAPVIKFISDGNFTTEVAILHVTILILGGLGSFAGPFIGSAIFVMVPELLRPVAELRLAVFGLILIVVILFMPGGVYGFLSRFLRSRFAGSPKEPPLSNASAAAIPSEDLFADRPFLPRQERHPSPDGKIVLSGKGLGKWFGGIGALFDVDFELREGEIVGLIGPNGAGKTTFFRLLSGFEKPTKGQLVYHGANIVGLPPDRRADMGIVCTFQEVRVFRELTVIEHLMVARHLRGRSGLFFDVIGGSRTRQIDQTNRHKAMALLQTCGLASQWNALGKNLSYGEMKNLSVAMALATEPKVLLLDEPTSGLSAEEAQSIGEVIRRINAEGVSLIVVEHNVPFITQLAHRMIAFDLGQKIADGTPREVVSNQKVITAYLGE